MQTTSRKHTSQQTVQNPLLLARSRSSYITLSDLFLCALNTCIGIRHHKETAALLTVMLVIAWTYATPTLVDVLIWAGKYTHFNKWQRILLHILFIMIAAISGAIIWTYF